MSPVARTVRLNELVKRALCVIIEREFTHKDLGWVTVSRVVVSKDIQHARVFFTVLGNERDESRALGGLRHAQPFIRSKLAAAVHLRYTPALIFEIDHELKEALRIDSLIEHLHNNAAPSPTPKDHDDDPT